MDNPAATERNLAYIVERLEKVPERKFTPQRDIQLRPNWWSVSRYNMTGWLYFLSRAHEGEQKPHPVSMDDLVGGVMRMFPSLFIPDRKLKTPFLSTAGKWVMGSAWQTHQPTLGDATWRTRQILK